MGNCERWFVGFLRKNLGYALVDTAREEAKQQGYSKSELKAARKSLGVKTHHQFDMGWDTGNLYWYLPEMGGRFD